MSGTLLTGGLPGGELLALEAKAGFTLGSDYFRQLSYWRSLSDFPAEWASVVVANDARRATEQGTYLPWLKLPGYLQTLAA